MYSTYPPLAGELGNRHTCRSTLHVHSQIPGNNEEKACKHPRGTDLASRPSLSVRLTAIQLRVQWIWALITSRASFRQKTGPWLLRSSSTWRRLRRLRFEGGKSGTKPTAHRGPPCHAAVRGPWTSWRSPELCVHGTFSAWEVLRRLEAGAQLHNPPPRRPSHAGLTCTSKRVTGCLQRPCLGRQVKWVDGLGSEEAAGP